MPIWNKALAALAFSAALAVPAFADGTPGQKVNRGPEPVQPHQPAPAPAPTPKPIKQSSSTSTPCCGTTTRRIVKQHPPVVTKRTVTHRRAPAQPTVTRREVVRQRTVQASSEVRLDLASFTGGVGNGVDGGFYGGGGGIVISTGSRYSGVLSHGASVFTFNRRTMGGHGKKGGKRYHHGGGCGGCK